MWEVHMGETGCGCGERWEGGGSVCSIWGWRVEVWGIRFE